MHLAEEFQRYDPATKRSGCDGRAKELIRFYVQKRTADRDFWDLSKYPFAQNVTDPDVVKAFMDKLAALGGNAAR